MLPKIMQYAGSQQISIFWYALWYSDRNSALEVEKRLQYINAVNSDSKLANAYGG